MGLHDDYAGAVVNSEEFNAFKRDLNKNSLSSEEIEAIVKKYKYEFVINEDDAKTLVSQLPAGYNPDPARIEKQRAVSERLNEEMVRAEVTACFNPIVRAGRNCGKDFFKRDEMSLLSAIALYGSEESKQLLTEKGNELSLICKQLEELKANQKIAKEKALKEARRNPDYKSEELAEINQQLDELNRDFQAKRNAFRSAYRELAPNELRRFASEMDGFVDKLNQASDPEYLLANYQELRIKCQMFGESVPIMEKFKNAFSKEEFRQLNIEFGRAYGPQFKLLEDACIIAHPIGKHLDVVALKAVDSKELETVLNSFTEKAYGRTQRLIGEYEADPLKQKVMPSASGESNLIDAMGRNVTSTFNLWNSNIRNLYGEDACDILIETLDGRNMVLTEETMVLLYKEGKPFFAQPKTVQGVYATLFQPLTGYDLAYGDGIRNAQLSEPGEEPEAPGAFVRAWDSVISAIGSLFNLNWRVDSVVKYEAALDLYTTKKNLFDGLTYAKENQEDLLFKGGMIELDRYAAELDNEQAAKAAQEEAERVAAERKEMLDNAGLKKEQRSKTLDLLKACDYELKNGGTASDYQKQFANVVTAFTTRGFIEAELQKAAQTGALSAAFTELLQSVNDGGIFLNREAEKLAAEPELTGFLGSMTKETFNKIVNGKSDSVTAANILQAASDYKTFKAQEKEKKENSLSKENVKTEEKVIENLVKKMN